jgi:hypothetical protein
MSIVGVIGTAPFLAVMESVIDAATMFLGVGRHMSNDES